MNGTKLLLIAIALTARVASAEPQSNESQTPDGTQNHIPDTEIRSVLSTMKGKPIADSVLRVLSIGGEYNVGASIVRRAKVDGKTPPDAIKHREITEVYHVLEGNGVLVIGGAIEGEKDFPDDSPIVRKLVGPSSFGSSISNGSSRRVEPGDVVIIPPNVPHGFSEITTDEIVYLLIRVDPHRVLQEAGHKP